MKRKLFLGLLAAAAVSFTACQKDQTLSEVTEDNTAIGFGTYVGRNPQTKATVTNIGKMQESTYPGFGVFACATDANDYNSTTAPAFMTNEQVNYSSSESDWTYDPVKYWTGDKISFFAYAPFDGVGITNMPTNETAGDPTITFTVQDLVSEQYDLLYSTPATNKTSGLVSLTFNHALSKIGFKVNVETGFKITINSITLKGKFNTSGKLNLFTGAWSNFDYVDDKTYLPSFTASNITTTAVPVEITNNDGYLMLLPTEFSPSNKLEIIVDYNYWYEYGGADVDGNKTVTGYYEGSLVQGNAYTFVLSFSPLEPIKFSATVSEWDPHHEVSL